MSDRPSRTPARAGMGQPALPARRHAALCLAGALVLAQLPACATESAGRRQPVAMSIVDRETGQTLTNYRKDGRTFVAGRPASRYAIHLANRTGDRVLVVLSVDGLNVVSGETAAVGQTGYVLGPWQSYDIAGWRKSDTAIAAFVFAALSDSYAARTGRPDNVGVIGMAVFQERPAPQARWPRQDPPVAADRLDSAGEAESRAEAAKADSATRNAAQPAAPAARSDGSLAAGEVGPPAAARLAQTERLGTGHGQREWSVSRRTTFERLSSTPQDVVEIDYDSYANLVLAGVIPAPTARARPFPSDDPRGFVPDPPAQ
jgi:hypothetical protein